MGKNNKVIVSQDTGLTPVQEQVAILLASGASITEVSNQTKVSRATIYVWKKQVTFKCFYNSYCCDARDRLLGGLYALADEALSAIKDSLQSPNEQVRLKTAIWIADKLQETKIQDTDAIEVIKEECTYADNSWADEYLHEAEYKDRLQELGLQERTLQDTL